MLKRIIFLVTASFSGPEAAKHRDLHPLIPSGTLGAKKEGLGVLDLHGMSVMVGCRLDLSFALGTTSIGKHLVPQALLGERSLKT